LKNVIIVWFCEYHYAKNKGNEQNNRVSSVRTVGWREWRFLGCQTWVYGFLLGFSVGFLSSVIIGR